ncbi:MAG TPA: NlpC/P60 family protein [Candidatus Limnocylindria bacterium]|nr:NlpC/P60 family protein [Candidatus Limnocylindria bacterium]
MNTTAVATRRSAHSGVRGRLMLVLALSVVVVGILPGPVQAGWLTDTWPGSTATPGSEADQVLDLARRQVGKPYRFAAVGPDAFDCSGLVWFLFKSTGLADRMGGKRRGATAYLNWFKEFLPNQVSNNLADARPGDILIWGGGKHTGIYISGNWAVSALNSRYDVRIHRADPMGLPFTAVLMVSMSRGDGGGGGGDPTPTPDPEATPSPDPAGAPMPPTSLDAAVQDELAVSLSWSGATGDATPLKYRVYRNGAFYVGSRYETLLDHPWLPGHYNYSIQTVDATGARSFRSEEVGVDAYFDGTDLDAIENTPPSAPTGLAAQSLGNKQVALSWQPSTDPSGVGYLVKRGTKIIARVFTTGYVDTPSQVGTYKYSVVAFDAYGNNVGSGQVDGVSAW